ncbi:MAG: SpoIIE family protein phosphatase [Clostridia bacterium]|nr:SpoIIE family protein phosphatase [Clostridia bacterium]
MQKLKMRVEGLIEAYPETADIVFAALRFLGVFASGFVLSLGRMFTSLSPLGAAYAMSVPAAELPAAAGGAILGYVVTGADLRAVKYIAAILTGTILIYTARRLSGKRLRRAFVAVSAGSCVAASGLAFTLGAEGDAFELLLCLAEGAVGGCFCYFMQQARLVFSSLREKKVLRASELAAVLAVASAFLLSLSRLDIYGVSPARMVACFLVLICAIFGRESAGSIGGVCFGALMGFADGAQLFSGALPLGGLFAAAAGRVNRFFAAVAFMIGNAFVYLFAGDAEGLFAAAIETGAAALAVTLLPRKTDGFFSAFFLSPGYSDESENMKELLRYKLKAASDTVYEVCGTVRRVSGALGKLENRNERAVYEDVRELVCADCERRKSCWEYQFDATLDAFSRLTMRRKNGEPAAPDALPDQFARRCGRTEALTACFNERYTMREFKRASELRLAETRRLAADQFTSVSVMLNDLARELGGDVVFSPETGEKARAAAEESGLRTFGALCEINAQGYMTLQIYASPADKKISVRILTEAVNAATGVTFAPPVIDRTDPERLGLFFCEKPPYSVRAGASQYVGAGQSVCGDAYDFFNDGRGHFVMILSDGMGTGSRAAVDGAMTVNLAARLLRAGFGFECAVKIVNSALMVKSREETLATLDIICVDLFEGTAAFYKAGAAASLICRTGRVIRVDRASMPLGILRDVDFERETGQMNDGDLLIMMSDGAADIPRELLRERLALLRDERAEDIAAGIASLAREEAPAGRADDITVIAAKVRKSKF